MRAVWKKCGKTWIRRKMCTFYAFSETDQIYSQADCKKSNERIYSTPVPNKILWISASFKLWYLIVAQLLLEIFKNKTVPWTNTHCAKCTFFSDFMFYHFFQIVRFYTIFKLSSCISLKLWFRYCVADSENGIKIWNSVGLVGESVNIMEIAVLECTKW